MILDKRQIVDILKNNPNKKLVKSIQDYSKKLVTLMTGSNLKEYISHMDYFEDNRLLAIRQKYARSTKDLFSRLHRPIDKVFSARGGSANYYLSEREKKQFLQALSDVTSGYKLRKWMETFWLPAYHYDPMGMVFMEVKNGNTYPTYKSCQDVYDYHFTGRKLEYIVFKISDADAKALNLKDGVVAYRVIDDAFDYIFTADGEKIENVKKQTYPNYFGQVPAIVNSDIYDQVLGYYISPDNDVVEIAEEYLREGSVKTVYKLHHGFPIKWMYAGACNTCGGTTKIHGNECPTCAGTGKKSKYDVSETIILDVPSDNQTPIVAPNIAGYTTPPTEGLNAMTDELTLLDTMMFRTKWGTEQIQDSANETATGRFIDVQPVNDALNKYSDAAEKMETWITDMIGSFTYQQGYHGADINYGRRFLIETPDIIWNKYSDARIAGAPITTLNLLLTQYYQTGRSLINI